MKLVLDKIKAEGLIPTLEAVFNKLEQPLPLGYCNVGRVIDVGSGVQNFKVGDRVASNGQHAEYVSIPQNLVAHIPDNVSDDSAAFTVIGAIGLQGIRLIEPTMGETIVVVGLGLIGLLTSEMLLANGCNVIGYDLDDKKVEIAKSMGVNAFNPNKANDPVNFVNENTNNIGADGVIITASSKSNDIIADAAQMCRKRGRIVLVGIVGLDISRAHFYEKELTFQVSCSYGPGRYDDIYEQKGIDYPISFVRWTEKRNFETVLGLISSGKINPQELISETVNLENMEKIYGNIENSKSIASIIKYNQHSTYDTNIKVLDKQYSSLKGSIGIIGSGNFTKMTLLPVLTKLDYPLKSIVSSAGVNGTSLAKKFKIPFSSTDYNELLDDKDIDMVLITTRPNMHSKMVIDAVKKSKHVFVEKPLAINQNQLFEIVKAYKNSNFKKTINVGFNRRFSPHIRKMKEFVGNSVLNVVATMNAGYIPNNTWYHDMEINGGRIISEGVHYIDLITYLVGSKVKSVCMNALGNNPSENTDNASILLKYENGSTGVVNYFSNGNKGYSKERVEVYFNEKTLIMDNFRETKGFGISGFKKLKTRIDKGHKYQFEKLILNLKESGKPIIPFDEIVNVTQASFAAIQSLKNNLWIDIDTTLYEVKKDK